jgi:hypothetical protein
MKPSSSLEQQSVEGYILDELNKQERLKLESKKLQLSDGISVQLDGFDEEKDAVCEIYAHIGKLKGSQPDKVASDFLKMLLVEKYRERKMRKYFCFVSEEAASKVKGNSWLASVAKNFGIEIKVIELPEDKKSEILEAQERQKMVNKNE